MNAIPERRLDGGEEMKKLGANPINFAHDKRQEETQRQGVTPGYTCHGLDATSGAGGGRQIQHRTSADKVRRPSCPRGTRLVLTTIPSFHSEGRASDTTSPCDTCRAQGVRCNGRRVSQELRCRILHRTAAAPAAASRCAALSKMPEHTRGISP